MIDKELIGGIVEKALEGTDNFLVEVKVTPDNSVTVEIDSMTCGYRHMRPSDP